MRKSKFSEYQIVKILKSVEGGRTVLNVPLVYSMQRIDPLMTQLDKTAKTGS